MNKKAILGFLLTLSITPVMANSPAADAILESYRQLGVMSFDAQAGQQLWKQDFDGRSCGSCHGQDLTQTGKHVKTKKTLKPMAVSVNVKRFSKEKKIEKWFKRNCKWTLGRECSPQEKGDMLTWLLVQ